jgi:hypothetical protein
MLFFVSCLGSASAACEQSSERILCSPQLSAEVESIKPSTPSTRSQPIVRLDEMKSGFAIKPFHLMEMAALSGMAADIASSWGCAEGNPMLRNADGSFGARGLAVKASITGGVVLLAHLLHRKYPSLDKPLGIVLGATGGFLHATAIRNRSFGCY